MKLSELFREIHVRLDTDIKGITNNSNEVKPGYLFAAVKGSRANGSQFIEDAINRGGAAVVCENEYSSRNNVSFVKVDSVQKVLPEIAKRFYGNPSSKLIMTGITGTNGKTTTAYLLRNIYLSAGIPTGLLGTIDYIIGDRRIPAELTTPDVLKVNQYLSQMLENKCKACVMEVSSHALTQGRVSGINFHTCIYTNLGRDHLDYHKSVENYLDTKTKLFKNLTENDWAVVNIDDPYSEYVLKNTGAKIVGYGIDKISISSVPMDLKLRARGVKFDSSGMKFSVYTSGFGNGFLVETKLIGYHNIYNILAAAGAALASGISEDAVKQGILMTENVSGRLEKVDEEQPFGVFIDFAHTPDALESALHTVKNITKNKVILVFGCGGDRDKEKRSLMGRIAGRMADYSVITADNSRSEDPAQIISQITKGFTGDNYKVIIDRKEAIYTALKLAEPGDVVLIAGKGHENYQISKNMSVPFNDKEVTAKLLRQNFVAAGTL